MITTDTGCLNIASQSDCRCPTTESAINLRAAARSSEASEGKRAVVWLGPSSVRRGADHAAGTSGANALIDS